MRKMMMKKSKKGITLVESVFAVVILATLTIGVISLLTAGGVKIFEISSEADAYSQAVQKLDLVMSAVSNGSSDYIVKTEIAGSADVVSLDVDVLKATLDIEDVTVTAVAKLYDTSLPATESNLRGWYITVSYKGATVKGFVSNSGGVFDR